MVGMKAINFTVAFLRLYDWQTNKRKLIESGDR
jgi:hypothetical protein